MYFFILYIDIFKKCTCGALEFNAHVYLLMLISDVTSCVLFLELLNVQCNFSCIFVPFQRF